MLILIYAAAANSIVFFDSDFASVNSGVKKGLAVKLRKAFAPWLVFVWCLSQKINKKTKELTNKQKLTKPHSKEKLSS